MHHVYFGSKACKIRLLSSLGLPELTEDEIALARQQDRLDHAATEARSVWRNAGPPACPPLGGWTGTKYNACSGDFWSRFCCSFSRFHSNSVARQGSFVSAHALGYLGVPVPLSLLLSFTLCLVSPGGSVICLCCSLPRHRRLPTRTLVRTVPYFLMDSKSGWCFVRLDLRGSPGADGFSSAFVGQFEIACTKSSLCFLISPSLLLRQRVLVCKATASTCSS